MNFLRWIIALPIIVGAVLFALANPQDIKLIWSPLHDATILPLYVLVLGFLAIGFLLGVFLAWVGMHKTRKQRRQYKKEAQFLKNELEESNEKLMDALSKRGPETLNGSIPTLIDKNENKDD